MIFLSQCGIEFIYVWLFTITWDAVAVCAPFWFWAILRNRALHRSLFPEFLFIRFWVSVLEIPFQQLHVSFVPGRAAQHDVMGKALDLWLGFLLGAGFDLFHDLRHSTPPLCISFFSWHLSACLFPIDATFFQAGTSFPNIRTLPLMSSNACGRCFYQKSEVYCWVESWVLTIQQQRK